LQNDNKIKALITLLDDRDFKIYNQIEIEILHFGKDAIPMLMDAWSSSMDHVLQGRIEDIIHKIQYDDTLAKLIHWKKTPDQDLLTGTYLMARFQYPDLDYSKIEQQINQIAEKVSDQFESDMSVLERIRAVNYILFNSMGFRGNTENFHAPQNSFINIVLESHKGSPLLLSIIYSLVCLKVDLPVYGVNLPQHFVLGLLEEKKTNDELEKSEVLFYINPFNKGDIFGANELGIFLERVNLPRHEIFYRPCSNLEILKRLARNLHYSYEKLGYPEKSNEIDYILSQLD